MEVSHFKYRYSSADLLYKFDPDLDPDLQKKQALYQISLYEL